MADGTWVYKDTRGPVPDEKDRPCGHCKLPNRVDEHDACLGELPSIINACCGHGVTSDAYIQFWDSSCIRGVAALAYMKAAEAERP